MAGQALVLIVALMLHICIDFTRGRGFFFEPKKFLAAEWLWLGYVRRRLKR